MRRTAHATRDMQPGEVIEGLLGDYCVHAWHAEGGFGVTYRALHQPGAGAPAVR